MRAAGGRLDAPPTGGCSRSTRGRPTSSSSCPRPSVPATAGAAGGSLPADRADAATRLWLKALAAADDGKGARPTRRCAARCCSCSADRRAARAQIDVLTNCAADIVARASAARHAPSATALSRRSTRALRGCRATPTLSRADRIGALIAPRRPGAARRCRRRRPRRSAEAMRRRALLVADVREQAARADREITDGYERQAVITAAAYLLAHAGLSARVGRAAEGQPGARATRRTT